MHTQLKFSNADSHTHRMHGHSSTHKNLHKLSLKVIIQTLSGEWKGNREKGREFKGGSEETLDGEMKNKLHKKIKNKEAQKKNLLAFHWFKLMTDVDACARVALQRTCSEMKGMDGSFPRPPTSAHPDSINYTQTPFPSTNTKKWALLSGLKTLDDLYMCEPIGVALHDKDWPPSPWGEWKALGSLVSVSLYR